MTRASLPIMPVDEPNRDVGIQTALILASINGEELRVLNANEDEVELESPDPLPTQFSLSLAVFNLPEWEYVEFRFEHSRVLERKGMAFSEICRVSLGRNLERNEASYRECLAHLKSMWRTGRDRDGSPPSGLDSRPVYQPLGATRPVGTFHEQRRAWFSPTPSKEMNAAFSKLARGVEHAFSVSTPGGYETVLELGCSEAVERALGDLGLSAHGLFSESFRRLYIGNEFCHHLFPEDDRLFALLDAGRTEDLGLTVVSPHLMEHTVEGMRALLGRLEAWSAQNETPLEIVINDWGSLDLLKETAPSLTPTLGKLLNKRKKDPRARWYWGYAKHETDLQENNLNVGWYRRFLGELGIDRFEYEAGPMRARIPGGGHSLHYPYYYTNASVFCMLYAEVTEFYAGKQKLVEACPCYCTDFCYIYPEHLKLVGKGNRLFGFDDRILVDGTSLQNYIDQGIDRLVFMPDC